MLITDNFVVLNLPKTGSTFVRTVLKRAHGYSPRERLLGSRKIARYWSRLGHNGLREKYTPGLLFEGHHTTRADQHGSYSQLPRRYRNRKAVTIARNPYDRLVSMYHWAGWKRTLVWPEGSGEYDKYPTFPELSFDEALDIHERRATARLKGIDLKTPLGPQTIQFILIVFKKPYDVLRRIDEDYIDSGAYRADLPDLHLLRNENLNQDLYDFLITQSYAEADIRFIMDEAPIRPPGSIEKPDRPFMSYFSEEQIREIRESERLLFRIFKNFGITY